MTTPDERMRAIRFGRETLSDLTTRTDVSARIRTMADEILQRYPTHDDLVGFLETQCLVFPRGWADALRDARRLLQKVGRSRAFPAGTPFLVLATLRHFPDEGLLECVSRGPVAMTWLAHERDWSQHAP